MAAGLFSGNNWVSAKNMSGVTFVSGLLDQKLARRTAFKSWMHAQAVPTSQVLFACWISARSAPETKY